MKKLPVEGAYERANEFIVYVAEPGEHKMDQVTMFALKCMFDLYSAEGIDGCVKLTDITKGDEHDSYRYKENDWVLDPLNYTVYIAEVIV